MTPERWSRIREILAAAVETPEAERSRFLDSACAGDAELRAEVERMLAAHEEPSWRSPAAELLTAATAELSPGDTVAHYRIEARLGEGGMGVVYRASDSRLRRNVALKLVKSQFNSRNQREARAVAALNHPNICTLYDVGPNYLVMELIEGPTLAERMAKGAIPLVEALGIARQIAQALEAAHEKGIVHRDLKPANIKLTADGTVKVLDFGLAKAQGPGVGGVEDSPTMTGSATGAGMILGTAGYMSPEQAGGKAVDKRADIWSFGVVLWEMLAGRRLFEGETVTETLAGVLRGEIGFGQLPRGTPPAIRGLLRRCLDRDVKTRLRDIGEARIAITSALAGGIPPGEDGEEPRRARPWLAWSVAAAAIMGFASIAFLHFREKPPAPATPVRFPIPVPDNAELALSVSPDGRKLAFIAGVKLWVYSFETGESRELAASGGVPFWSPDSRYIGYPSEGKVKKIEASGGPAQTVAEFRGGQWGCGAWNRDDVIVFGDRATGMFRVPASGGAPVQITALDPARHENNQFCPSFLPDGRHFVYVRASPPPGQSAIFLGSVDAKPEQQSLRPLVASDSQPVYAPSTDPETGYLLFVRERTLMAQQFDNRQMEMKGQAVPIAEQVSYKGAGAIYVALSASANGVLVYPRRSVSDLQFTWYDREGKVMGTAGEPGAYQSAALSPDGTRLATTMGSGAYSGNLWVLDLAPRGGSTRLTYRAGADMSPVWLPDGSRIVFSSNRDGPFNLYQKPANGAKDEEVLLATREDKHPTSWSPDGRFLLYTEIHPKTKRDIWALPMEGGGKPFPFLVTEFAERQARFSPDGRWVAYVSDESGRTEVYVRRFSLNSTGTGVEPGGRWPVSNEFGEGPHWRGDGRELYYVSADRRVMAVDVAANPEFRAGNPKPLGVSVSGWGWDCTADGKRFISLADKGGSPYEAVLNWQAGLKK